MTNDLRRQCNIEEIWAQRLVMQDAMNAGHMAAYIAVSALGHKGDKANPVASRIPRLDKVPTATVTAIRKART